MKLKKLVSLALVGVMTLSLAACSSGKTGKSKQGRSYLLEKRDREGRKIF